MRNKRVKENAVNKDIKQTSSAKEQSRHALDILSEKLPIAQYTSKKVAVNKSTITKEYFFKSRIVLF
jgi:hypothetical protein